MRAGAIAGLGAYGLIALVVSYVFVEAGYTAPVKSNLHVVSTATIEETSEQRSARGRWKKDNTGAYNFFCSSDGSYGGHVKYQEAGYWNTYSGDNSRGTFVDLASAKRYVELKVAKCD